MISIYWITYNVINDWLCLLFSTLHFFEHYVEITLFIGFEKFEKKRKKTLEDAVINYLLYPLIFLLF